MQSKIGLCKVFDEDTVVVDSGGYEKVLSGNEEVENYGSGKYTFCIMTSAPNSSSRTFWLYRTLRLDRRQ